MTLFDSTHTKTSMLWLVAMTLGFASLSACSKEQGSEPTALQIAQAQEGEEATAETDEPRKKKTPEELYPELTQLRPLDLSTLEATGYGLYHGTITAFQSEATAATAFKRAMGLRHVMYHVQTYDELAVELGEYTYYPVSMAAIPQQRGPEEFGNSKPTGLLRQRTIDLQNEIKGATMRAGEQAPASESVVVDLWRKNRSWYVRWDGLLNPENRSRTTLTYGLADDDMVAGVLKSIEETAREVKPKYLVIGDEMDRLYAQEGSAGIAKQEWSALIAFFQDAVERVKSASPETKVGIGINWDNFISVVALEYAKDANGGTAPTEVTQQVLDEAFRAILLPLIESGGILTLRSSAVPGDGPFASYQFLRRLPDLYGVNPPVVWYSISSPIESPAGQSRQRNFVKSFIEWNAGVNVEAVYWTRLANIDGANGANDTILGRCRTMVEDTQKDFVIPKSNCFDGLFDTGFSIKPAFGEFETAIKGM